MTPRDLAARLLASNPGPASDKYEAAHGLIEQADEIDRLHTALTRTIATFSAIGSLDDFVNTKSQRKQALAEASAALGDNWKP